MLLFNVVIYSTCLNVGIVSSNLRADLLGGRGKVFVRLFYKTATKMSKFYTGTH